MGDDVLAWADSLGGNDGTPKKKPQPDNLLDWADSIAPTPSKYDNLFEKHAQANGIDPDLLRAMTNQESTFKPKAISPKGAQGLMQLMPGTARRFKVSNVYDPDQNIRGGAQYMKFLLDRYNGDVPKALAGYNAGEGAVDKYKGIPPFRETRNYVKKITGKYKGSGYAPAVDENSVWSDVDSLLGGPTKLPPIIPQPPPEPTQTLQTPPDIAPLPATALPVPTAPVAQAPVQPLVEAPTTIEAQITSMMDQKSPRSAVLLTDDIQRPMLANMSGVSTVKLPEGTLVVNSKKLGIKPADIPAYVKKNGFASLIGKVEDHPDTTTGIAVRTEDANGNELTTSKVTPQNVQAQAALDKQQFPQVANHEVVTPPVAVAKRADQLAREAQPAYSDEPVISDVPEPQPKPARQMQAAVGVVDVDPKLSSEDKLRQAAGKLLVGRQTPTGPITQDDIENWINASKQAGIPVVVGGSKDSSKFTITQSMFDQIYEARKKSPEQLAEELKQRVIAPPSEDFLRQQAIDELSQQKQAQNALVTQGVMKPEDIKPITEDEIQAKIAEQKALEPTQESKSSAYDVAQKTPASIAGVYGGVGSILQQAAGLVRPLGLGYESLSGLAKEMQSVSGYRHQGEGPKGIGEHVAGFLGETVPQLAELTFLPGGAVAKFAGMGGLSAAGAGENLGEVAKETAKGAATGGVFRAAEEFEKPLAKLGTVFGGSAAINALSGMPIDQNIQNAIVNTLFEAQGIYGPKIYDKVFKFWNGGDSFNVHVTPQGEVNLVSNQAPATGGEIVLDPKNVIEPKTNETNTQVLPQPAPLASETGVPPAETVPPKTPEPAKSATAEEPRIPIDSKLLFEKKEGLGMSKKPIKMEGKVAGYEKDNEGHFLYDVRWTDKKGNDRSTLIRPDEIVQAANAPTIEAETGKISPPPEKGFDITAQTGPTPTTAIGKVVEQRNAARREADTDVLTGLPNNVAFEKAKTRLEADPEIELTSVDLNNFKAINDKNGHPVGDQALKDAGQDLLTAAKKSSPQAQVFRPHGDEFIIASSKGTGADIVKNADDVFSQRKYGETSGSLAGSSGNTYAEAEKGLPAAKAERKAKVAELDNPSPSKGGANAGVADTHSLSDLVNTDTFRQKGLSGFDRPTQRLMMSMVFRGIKNPEIRDVVVKFIPVDMVDMLSRSERPPQVSLHNNSVFRVSDPVHRDVAVTISSDRASALIRILAGRVTKEPLVSLPVTGGPSKGLPAMGTANRNAAIDRTTSIATEKQTSEILTNLERGSISNRDTALGTETGGHSAIIANNAQEIPERTSARNNPPEPRPVEQGTSGRIKETGGQAPVETKPPDTEPAKGQPKPLKGVRSLSEFVRKMGGIKSTKWDTGEHRRISNKETGTTGLINNKSGVTAERMAEVAWESGYLHDEWPEHSDINGNEFMSFIEDDYTNFKKHYSREDEEQRFNDDFYRQQEEEYFKKQESDPRAREEYAKRQDELLGKQTAFLNNPEAQKLLAKVDKEAQYDSEGNATIPNSETRREYYDKLDQFGLEPYIHDAAVLEAYREARKEPQPETAQNLNEVQPQRDNEQAKTEVAQSSYGSKNKLVTTDRAEKARETLRKKLGGESTQFNSGPDPELIKAASELALFHVEAGARKFADFSTKMIADIGENIRPYLRQIYNDIYQKHEIEGMDKPTPESIQITGIKKSIDDAERELLGYDAAPEVKPHTWEEAKNKAAAIIQKDPFAAQKLVTELNNKPRALSDTETMVLLHHKRTIDNDYNATVKAINESYEAKDETQILSNKARLAVISDERQSLMNAGRRSGTEKGRSLNVQRALMKEDFSLASLEAQKRAANNGRPLTDAEKSKLESLAKEYQEKSDALEKRLAEREKELADVQKDLPNKRIIEAAENIVKKLDARADIARERLKKRGAVFTSGLDPMVMRDFAEIGASHIAKVGLDFIKFSDAMVNEFGEKIKPHLKEIFDRANKIIDGIEPKRQGQISEDSRLKGFKTRTANRIQEIQAKLANNDFTKKTRQPLVLDKEATQLKIEVERLKRNFERELRKDQLKNRPAQEKALDLWSKYVRAGMLSWPTTIGKLTNAAMGRMILNPVEEGIKTGIAKVSGIDKTVPTTSIRTEAKAARSFITQGMKDSWQMFRNKDSDLDLLAGKEKFDHGILDYFGQIHGALKAPVKRAGFERSLQKQIELGLRNGEDVYDPLIQMKYTAKAYEDANRDIFMQDNRLVNAYRSALGRVEARNRETGKVPIGGKAIATAARTLFPIVKIPLNYIGETTQYAIGSVTGSVKLGMAFRKGLENVSTAEKEQILRHLSKGSLGLGALLLGYFNPLSAGGYYQPGEKRDPQDVKAARFRLYGVDIPSWASHIPILEAVQLGATIRRVADAKFKKSDAETKGLTSGALAGGLGLAEEAPFVKETVEMSKLMDPKERGDFAAEFAKSRLIPGVSQWLANQTDKQDGIMSDPVKRKPETFVEHLMTGIPGLRQQVQTKAEARDIESSTTDDMLELIKDLRREGKDSKVTEKQLMKKIYNARKGGTLTRDEVDRINEVFPDLKIMPRDVPKKRQVTQH